MFRKVLWVVVSLLLAADSATAQTFGQITGIAGGTALTNAAYVERMIKLGVRFAF